MTVFELGFSDNLAYCQFSAVNKSSNIKLRRFVLSIFLIALSYHKIPPGKVHANLDSRTRSSFLDLLPKNALQGNGICGEFTDTFSELLNGHLFFVEVEAE